MSLFTVMLSLWLHFWCLYCQFSTVSTALIYFSVIRFKHVLRAKTAFKIWNFHFAQILTESFEKQHVLTLFNFFFKFLSPMLLVHVNWIVFYVTAYLFKFYNQQISRKTFHVVTKTAHEVKNSVWIWKMIVDKTGKLHKSQAVMFSK